MSGSANVELGPAPLAVVIRCGRCRCVVFAAINRPEVIDAATRSKIGELASGGCTVEHLTAEAVRAAQWGCECHLKEIPS